jgi:translation initiation factor 2 beta subunit (eIF-2beta)/eIF-5
MPSMRDKFYVNEIVNADFSSAAITNELALDIANALRGNRSVESIDFSCSNLKDNTFTVIAQGLKDRNIKLVELNLDITKLTTESIKPLKELMELGLIERLMMCGLKKMFTDPSIQKDLADYAKTHTVIISFEHPDDRPKIGFFDKNIDEKKEKAAADTRTNEVKNQDEFKSLKR